MNKAEKAKAYREELKAEGYCPRCYKRKAVAGKLHCKECEKYYYAYYHAHKAQRLEYAKQRREKLKAAGLCTQCGKRQQEKGLLCIGGWISSGRMGRKNRQQKMDCYLKKKVGR